MNIRKNKFLTLSLIAGLGLGMQACTDEEVAAGVGLVAIGAGVAIIAAGSDDDDNGYDHGYDNGYDRCEGGYVKKCTSYTDYWGDTVRECRNEWDSCANRRGGNRGGRGGRHGGGYHDGYRDHGLYSANLMQTSAAPTSTTLASLQSTSTQLSTQSSASKKVVSSDWAAQFNMSFDAAELFVASLEDAKDGDIKALSDLGLGQKDIDRLANERMPSFKGIDALAKTLNMSKSNTRKMVKDLLKEAKNQKEANCRIVGGHKNKVKVCN